MYRLPNIFEVVCVCLLSVLAASSVRAQQRSNEQPRVSPNAVVSQTIGTTKIAITYGRPSANGRLVFGGLVPYGKVWRTGANESTVIVFPNNVTVEGMPLKAGVYSIYTLPGKEKWTIIINSKLSWGLDYDKNKDVLRVQVKPVEAPFCEQFMIYFEKVTNHSAEVVLHWAQTKVPFTIEV